VNVLRVAALEPDEDAGGDEDAGDPDIGTAEVNVRVW